MAQPIVVPLDGTAHAEGALPLAVSTARRLGAPLHVVRVHEPVRVPHGNPLPPDTRRAIENADRRAREHEGRYLKAMAAQLLDDPEVAVGTALLDGPVGGAIASYARDREAALVVMSPRARSGVGRALAGSVSEQVIRRAGVPVLLAHPDAEPADVAGRGGFRRILVPLDGSEHAETILESAVGVADGPHASFVLLHVVAPELSYDLGFSSFVPEDEPLSPWREDVAAEGTLEMLDAALYLLERGFDVETRIAWSARPGEAITEVAGQVGADLVAIATHGRGWLGRLLFGSVTRSVLQHADGPVLVACPGRTARSATRSYPRGGVSRSPSVRRRDAGGVV